MAICHSETNFGSVCKKITGFRLELNSGAAIQEVACVAAYICLLLVTDRDAMASSAEEKLSAKLPVDDTDLLCASASDVKDNSMVLYDTNSSQEDVGIQQQPLIDFVGDEASSLQVPCLVPESVVLSSSSLPECDGQPTGSYPGVAVDSNMEVQSESPVTVAADSADAAVSMQKPAAESQPFDFVNDVMRSCSPKVSNKPATAVPQQQSLGPAVGEELKAAQTDTSKLHGTRHSARLTSNR